MIYDSSTLILLQHGHIKHEKDGVACDTSGNRKHAPVPADIVQPNDLSGQLASEQGHDWVIHKLSNLITVTSSLPARQTLSCL